MVDRIKIEFCEIDKIKEYEKNSKLHPDNQIEQIAKSIKEFGFNDPVAVDENNIIIEGHGRIKAAKLLEMKQIPIIKLKHLTEFQKKAYIIAHNKLTTNTGYDELIMANEIRDVLKNEEIDFEALGIDISFIEKLEKNIDISEFIDSTEKRKEDQQSQPKKIENVKTCPHCGGLIE